MDTTAVETTAPDFGVFAQLADYGPLGLAVLAKFLISSCVCS